ncbi:hypothetical protein HYPSUDRAFT_978598 [Hypholoma sublateritium FD-334 SS-4]|uniref:Uncharacterized protein n=1 Tax=Hypholoma sublateritium (strain FD-334 SS-4) TaxID=945553 RepID=A0A0D2LH79_HYPSF|nr:hypothetical protein HYPSUDRAFT_978598 [Hypholoma sublateritium FD-334 SS-4]
MRYYIAHQNFIIDIPDLKNFDWSTLPRNFFNRVLGQLSLKVPVLQRTLNSRKHYRIELEISELHMEQESSEEGQPFSKRSPPAGVTTHFGTTHFELFSAPQGYSCVSFAQLFTYLFHI